MLLICIPIIGVGQCIYGDCENGSNAIAEYTTQNGGTAKYDGGFKNGEFNGQGKYFQDGELMYDGIWLNGKMDGKGKYFQDGELMYDGYRKDDRRDGKGKYFQDGELMYDGYWKDDRRDGKGKYFQDGKLMYDGDWKDDRRTGNGKMFRNGKIYYNGEVIDGVENGTGTYYHENGKEYTVIWKDGKTGENIYDPNDIKGSISEKCEISLINDFGNSYKIDITVDGIKKQYTYDTGASYFTINSSMEKELISQGKIKVEDYYPPKRFRIANGEIIEKRIVRLDNIKIGDYIVNNVFVTITDSNDDGVLLCGLGLLKKKFSKEGRMGNTLILFR
jgi:hypothetical protein